MHCIVIRFEIKAIHHVVAIILAFLTMESQMCSTKLPHTRALFVSYFHLGLELFIAIVKASLLAFAMQNALSIQSTRVNACCNMNFLMYLVRNLV